MHLQSPVGKALCCFHGGIQNDGTHSLLKAVQRWLFPVQSGYLSVDRITRANTNRFNLLKGKMRMGNSVLNSKRSTGLLFSFLSPATLREVVNWSNCRAYLFVFISQVSLIDLYCLMPSLLKIFVSSILSHQFVVFLFCCFRWETKSSFC